MAEQLFILGYDYFEVEPLAITTKMELISQQLNELDSTNDLSPEKWDALKKQFIALKTIFNYTKTPELVSPAILSNLDKLFQGGREHLVSIATLLKQEVLQVKPNAESLGEFVASLGFTVLDAVLEKRLEEYSGVRADGVYSNEFNSLIDAIAALANTYSNPTETGIIDLSKQSTPPTTEEYEIARQQVIQLISKHVPFLITTKDLSVAFENIDKDFLRLESHFELSTPQFKELKLRFEKLKKEYQTSNSEQDNTYINQLIKKIEKEINRYPDLDEERKKLHASSTEKYHESMENALRIKSMRNAIKSRSSEDLQTVLLKLVELNTKDTVHNHYKELFFEAVIEQYNELPIEFQDSFVRAYYDDRNQVLKTINEELIALIQSLLDPATFSSELTKLKAQADAIINMDGKFSQHVSPTFIRSEAKLLRSMIVGGLFSGNLDSLKIDDNKAQYKEDNDKARAMYYTESIKQTPSIYLKEIHPVIKESDSLDKDFVAKQYEHLVSKQLKEVKDREYPSLQSLIDILRDDVNTMGLEDNDALVESHRQLIATEVLLKALPQIAQYQSTVDDLQGHPKVDYNQQISDLSEKVTEYKSAIESSDEYKAKLFLDKAERYLLARNWSVGFQWNTHTVQVEGTNKKIPATVAKQLEIIKEARVSGHYLEAKQQFIQLGLGKQAQPSWRTSKMAKEYYSMFKKDEAELEKKLDDEFTGNNKKLH